MYKFSVILFALQILFDWTCLESCFQNKIEDEMNYFLRSAGSFTVQRNGQIDSLRPSKLQNADEFDFSGGYRTEQGVFCGGPICASFVGYHPTSDSNHIFEQHLILSDLCPFGSVLHELMHTLGFQHEDDRYDRLHNLQRSSKDIEHNPISANMFDEYDHFSIMHKSCDSISLDPLRQFMIGQRIGLSFMDIKALNFAYKCESKCNIDQSVTCLHHGFIDKNCRCICPDGFEGQLCDKVVGMAENLQQQTTQSNIQYYGSNRRVIHEPSVVIPLDPESNPEKPILMLYDHHQQSNIEYDSMNNPSLQAAIFIYNPTIKMTVDLSSPSYLSDVYRYKDKVYQHDNINNDWLVNKLYMNQSSNVHGQLGKGTTLWLDANSFQLDQYHPIYYTSPNVSTLSDDSLILFCDFNTSPFDDPKCPMNMSNTWTHIYNESIQNGFMFIDNSMFNSGNINSGQFRLGPITGYVNESTCLSFDYKLSGKGVGGLSTYYIAKGSDRRQGSVFGWEDTGETWNHKVQNLSDIFYDKSTLKDVIIEFLILPGWDAFSSISIDNVKVDICSKMAESEY
ncbi:hypothetical protein GJ496_010355 [Pomphorhynchus laevis]|nr:hypothetical protein GJ496_010353 [Pomphorhynchus laevis]KAI0983741.1 hypothetical protein GJ496_010355 [Pomphorhynchus laevis]